MSGHLVVLVAVGSPDAARDLARAAVEARRAACAQILPVRSCYSWQGALREEDEHLVIFKTRADAYGGLEALIRARHPYTVPEIVALPVVAGWPAYLAWVDAAVVADAAVRDTGGGSAERG